MSLKDTERGQPGSGGLGEDDVAQIIHCDFGERRVTDWGLDPFAEAARRCDAEAERQTGEIADSLRRCAARYLRQAEGGAG